MTFARINDYIALNITKVVGTMWCAYAFAILVTIPLIVPSTNMVIMYISSSFLQLVLLPMILVGQSLAQRHREANHDESAESLSEMAVIIEEGRQEIRVLAEILDNQHQMLTRLDSLAASLVSPAKAS